MPPPTADTTGHEEDQDWDAAQEMNPVEEEHDFVQFISQIKGRNIDVVRKEVDNEISSLNRQRKAAMRDAEDVTQQMVHQIMVSLRHIILTKSCSERIRTDVTSLVWDSVHYGTYGGRGSMYMSNS